MKTTILIAMMGIGLFMVAPQKVNAQSDAPEGKVKTSYVCFVNNRYMGKEQIPVEVNDKTYYGCCMGCVGKLQNNRSQRYATDPLTGDEVDKATAYIVVNPNGGGEVLYFASEDTYKKYSK